MMKFVFGPSFRSSILPMSSGVELLTRSETDVLHERIYVTFFERLILNSIIKIRQLPK